MTRKKKHEPTKDNRGRPRLKFSQAIADRICREIAQGKSLRRTLKKQGMPKLTTVLNWLQDSTSFATQYARARQRGIDLHIDGMLDLADSATEENANAVRLRIDTRKWIASKLLPRVYGDRVEVDAMIASGAQLRDAATAIGVARRISFVLAQGAMAKARQDGAKEPAANRPRLPAPVPDPVYRDPLPSAEVRAAHPGASEPELKDINAVPERSRPKPGDGPTWHYGSRAEQGRDDK